MGDITDEKDDDDVEGWKIFHGQFDVSVRGKIRQGKRRGNKAFLYSLEGFFVSSVIDKNTCVLACDVDVFMDILGHLSQFNPGWLF